MGVINTGSYPKALRPGLKKIWGRNYTEKDTFYSKIFEKLNSDKKYEEYLEATGFGLFPEKAEGSSIVYDSESQGIVPRLRNTVYAMGYQVTEEEIDDCLYAEVGQRRTKELARSARITKETIHGNRLNNSFDTAYVMEDGDGKPLFATDHPTLSGDQSNKLATDADFAETPFEDLLIQIDRATNSRGLKIGLKAKKLIVPSELMFEACRVTKSPLQNNTANNAVNATKSLGMLPGGVIYTPYLSDTDAWFLITDCPLGLITQQRKVMKFGQDNDFDTSNMKFKAYERYGEGWVDFRGAYASAGA